jgi:uncharacterized protein (DUF1778 family)
MAASPQTITVRLPASTRRTLDRIAKATRRSRSFLMKEALERHLWDIAREQAPEAAGGRYARIVAMRGAGKKYSTYASPEDVIRAVREFRGDD